jgi:four helix bundle protein
MIEGLNRLQVYLSDQELAKVVYRDILPQLPSEEKYGLETQIRRAAASVPANIAEGYGRYYYQESIRFCYLARGSLMELSSHVDLVAGLGFLSDQVHPTVNEKITTVLKLIHGYINYLKQSKRGAREPGSNVISEEFTDYHYDDSYQKDETV